MTKMVAFCTLRIPASTTPVGTMPMMLQSMSPSG